MSGVLAQLLVLLMNMSGVGALPEDDALVLTMSGLAQGALLEAHPECNGGTFDWTFGGDSSVYGISSGCEWSAGFARVDGRWVFEVHED